MTRDVGAASHHGGTCDARDAPTDRSRPSAGAQDCCFDDLVWRVDNADAVGETERLEVGVVASPSIDYAAWFDQADVRLTQRASSSAGLRGPPRYDDTAVERRDQRRARLQVYVI